jgi:hypothetical protein
MPSTDIAGATAVVTDLATGTGYDQDAYLLTAAGLRLLA